jgi:trimeric autotransporter adhesin
MNKLTWFVLLCGITGTVAAQNIGIGTATPQASAQLDISSSSKGLLIPRLTTAQRNAVVSPAKGLLVFDSSRKTYWYFNGGMWKELLGDANNADSSLVVGKQTGTLPAFNINQSLGVLSDSSGFLYDSGGPSGNYGNNEDYSRVISSNTALAIDVEVISNNLESPYDSLTIEDVYGLRYVLTGNERGRYRFNSGVMVRFKSNFANTAAGFAIRWNFVYARTGAGYDPLLLSGWYFNQSKLYVRGGLNAHNHWHPDSAGVLSFSFGSMANAKGPYAFAAGSNTSATGVYSLAIGYRNNATGYGAVALGIANTAAGQAATALGSDNTSTGDFSLATGFGNNATGNEAVALGESNTASGYSAIALGVHNTAAGDNSIAGGALCKSLGSGAFAMGFASVARGISSAAIGTLNNAVGENSLASGFYAAASGEASFAFGVNTKSKHFGGTVVGIYNDTANSANPVAINAANRVFQIGVGSADNNRKNALTVLQNGYIGVSELNPLSLLHISGGSNAVNRILIEDTVNNRQVSVGFNSTLTGAHIGTTSNYSFSLLTNGIRRAIVSADGNFDIMQNLTVQNGKGIIRGIDGVQKKQLSDDVPVSATFTAGQTRTFAVTWSEAFGAAPDAYVGNVVSGSNGWAELVMTVAGVTSTGATLWVYNPKTTSVVPNFTVRIVAAGPQ